MSKPRNADCHPELKHYGHGMCRKCYETANYNYKKVLFKKTNMRNKHNKEYIYSKQPIVDIPDMLIDSYWIDQNCKMPRLLTV